MPEISVIITTYKRDQKFLKRAISSVLNQTFKDFELIIVDDNGDDKYSEIVNGVVNNINSIQPLKIISHVKNLGAQQARNSGINHAKGKYIAFLDDDDEWLENKLEVQLKSFKESDNPSLGLVYCGFNKITYDKNNRVKNIEKVLPILDNNEIIKNIYRKNYIGSTSLPLIKKECFETVGLFDLNLKAKQDYDMWIRISKRYAIDYVNEALCNYYAHNEERITNNAANKLHSELTFLNKYYDEIVKDKIAASIRFKQIGIYYYAALEFDKAKHYLWKSITKKPFPVDIKLLSLFVFAMLKVKPNDYMKKLLKVV